MTIVRNARWRLKVWRSAEREAKLQASQVGCILTAVAGIAGFSWQAALITAGVAFFALIEVQS
jgi:hypothetical protein